MNIKGHICHHYNDLSISLAIITITIVIIIGYDISAHTNIIILINCQY